MPPKPTPPTHFLCIPLVTAGSRPQLARALTAFRTDVCAPVGAGGFAVPEEAVRPVGTLHLTLGVFSLPCPAGQRNEGLERAVEILKGLRLGEVWARARAQIPAMPEPGTPEEDTDKGKGKAADGTRQREEEEEEELRITLSGMHSMQPAAKAAVLYAPPVDPLGRLQAFCEEVRRAFLEAEIMTDDKRPLLLHATVVNTTYVRGAKGNKGRGGRGRSERLTMDATGILDRYEDEVWVEEAKVESVAICKMGAKKVMIDGEDDEAYEVVAEVAF